MKEIINEWNQRLNSSLNDLDQMTDQDLVQYVNDRASWINGIMSYSVAEITYEARMQINHIMQLESAIMNRMENIRRNSQGWLLQQNQIRRGHDAYGKVYAAESILMDRRE